MNIAVFSDVHGNLEALQAFLEVSAEQNIDRYIFLGDIVGYGPNPNECIEAIQSLPNLSLVLGNHDAAAIWQSSPYNMHKTARKALFWTINELTDESVEFLKALDFNVIIEKMGFSHATPYGRESWTYLNSIRAAILAFSFSKYNCSFVSHTHRPLLISKKRFWKIQLETVIGSRTINLPDDRRWIINCGSIGQPRDGSPSSCYCIFNTLESTVTYHRINYDVDKTILKIKAAGLPKYLGERLQKGV